MPKHVKPPAQEMRRFSAAVDTLTRDALDMDELSDQYAEAIQQVVQAKAKKGQDVVELAEAEAEEEEGGAQVIDLMERLRKSLGQTGRVGPARSAERPARSAQKSTARASSRPRPSARRRR